MSYYSQKVIVRTLPKGTQRALKILIVLAAVVLICFLIGLFASSFAPISHIEISDTLGMSSAEILALAGIRKQSFWGSNAAKIARNIMAIPEVKEATVGKQFPRKLVIIITRREPVAKFISKVNQKDTLFFIDEQGVVFENPVAAETAIRMPTISDPSLDIQPGFQISPQLLKLILKLQTVDTNVMLAISEIVVNWKKNGSHNYNVYDLTLYMEYSTAKVYMNPDLNTETIKIALLTLDGLKLDNIAIKELDCRSDVFSIVPEYRGGFSR